MPAPPPIRIASITLCMGLASAAFAQQPALTGNDAGYYGGQPNLTPTARRQDDDALTWPALTNDAVANDFFVHQTNLDQFDDAAYGERFAAMVRESRQRGIRFIPRVLATHEGQQRFFGNVTRGHIDANKRGIERFFEFVNPDDLYALSLGEEHGAWGNTVEALNELYDFIKSRWPTVAVYQWYSGPQIAGYVNPVARADGWVINDYSMRNPRFRRIVMHYVALNKPVLVCLDASTFYGRGNKTRPVFANQIDRAWTDDYWSIWYEQMFTSREFDLPVFYFDQDQQLNLWGRFEATAPQDAINHALRQHVAWLKSLPAGPFPTAEFSNAQDAIEVAGDENGHFEYVDRFADSRFIRDATIDGFLSVGWEPGELRVRSRAGRPVQTSLTYEWRSYFPLTSATASIRGSVASDNQTIELGISRDGMTFDTIDAIRSDRTAAQVALPLDEPTQRFWVRIRFLSDGPVDEAQPLTLRELAVHADHAAPSEKVVELKRPENFSGFLRGHHKYVEYSDDFEHSNRWRHHAAVGLVDVQQPIASGLTVPSVAPVAGRIAHVDLVYHFVSDAPMRNIKVTASGAASMDLGGDFTIAVSRDGATWEHERRGSEHAPRQRRHNGVEGSMVFDLGRQSSYHGLCEIWVRLRASATAAVYADAPAGRLTGFLFQADADDPE